MTLVAVGMAPTEGTPSIRALFKKICCWDPRDDLFTCPSACCRVRSTVGPVGILLKIMVPSLQHRNDVRCFEYASKMILAAVAEGLKYGPLVLMLPLVGFKRVVLGRVPDSG